MSKVMSKSSRMRASRAKVTPARGPRLRLLPDERERLIVEEAIRYFAAVGFDAETRELAKRIGITQPLLYRYFPTKGALIDQVYKQVYLNRWKPVWETWIRDRSMPVSARLKRFYADYYPVIVNHDWMRIFFQAGMRNVGINKRYLTLVRERIFLPLCAELRHELNLPTLDDIPASPAEVELYWGLHGSIIYDGIRQYIYGLDVPPGWDQTTEMKIDIFLAGLPAVLTRFLHKAQQVD